MAFTTQIFMFVFLPVFLVLYFIIVFLEKSKKIGCIIKRTRLKDILLIIFGLIFYASSSYVDVLKLLILIFYIYFLTHFIQSFYNKDKKAGVIFAFTIIALTLNLIYFKYTGFLSYNISRVFMDEPVMYSVWAPLGISFITFSAISYVADVYKKKATAGSIIDCALYITFFPKVVSGPIVLWKDFQKQMPVRKYSEKKFVEGVNRVIIGIAKKCILADVFGLAISEMTIGNMDRITALSSLLIYMLQIYYDFSGYSDMAIGLSKMLGFDFVENFNFPYRSKSISEFWRRWHISLGSWFREYIYFPLGGSRKGKIRTLFNLGVVFALTGIWHGAGWTYILWGAINGVIVIVEHLLVEKKFYRNIPDWVKYIITMIIVMLFWQFFRCADIGEVKSVLSAAFGGGAPERVPYTWQYYLDIRMVTFVIIGVLGSTILGSNKVKEVYNRFVSTQYGYMIQEIAILALFILGLMFMVSSTYSPFIYFQY